MKHTPAHTTYIPDTFTDESGHEYQVIPDDFTDSPLDWGWGGYTITQVESPRRSFFTDRGNLDHDRIRYAWRELNASNNPEKFTRYLKAFHGITEPVTIHRYCGYSKGDLATFVVTGDDAIIHPFFMWMRGDVYLVECECDRVGGIYADTMEEAVNDYLENLHA